MTISRASPKAVPSIRRLIFELANYEKAVDDVLATPTAHGERTRRSR